MFQKVKAFFKTLWEALKALFKGQELTQEQKEAAAAVVPVIGGIAGAMAVAAAIPGELISTLMAVVIMGVMIGNWLMMVGCGYMAGRFISEYAVKKLA